MDPQKVDRWQRFGAVVRDARLMRGKTQQALADEAGVSRAWLARFESGVHRRAALEQVMRVLDALDLSLTIAPRERTTGERAVLEALAQHRPRRGST